MADRVARAHALRLLEEMLAAERDAPATDVELARARVQSLEWVAGLMGSDRFAARAWRLIVADARTRVALLEVAEAARAVDRERQRQETGAIVAQLGDGDLSDLTPDAWLLEMAAWHPDPPRWPPDQAYRVR